MNLEWLTVVNVSYAMLIAAMFLTVLRLGVGPSLPDRVVALDLMAILVVGFIATTAIDTERAFFLEGAAVLALIVFLGTVAFARYLERRAHDE